MVSVAEPDEIYWTILGQPPMAPVQIKLNMHPSPSNTNVRPGKYHRLGDCFCFVFCFLCYASIPMRSCRVYYITTYTCEAFFCLLSAHTSVCLLFMSSLSVTHVTQLDIDLRNRSMYAWCSVALGFRRRVRRARLILQGWEARLWRTLVPIETVLKSDIIKSDFKLVR